MLQVLQKNRLILGKMFLFPLFILRGRRAIERLIERRQLLFLERRLFNLIKNFMFPREFITMVIIPNGSLGLINLCEIKRQNLICRDTPGEHRVLSQCYLVKFRDCCYRKLVHWRYLGSFGGGSDMLS
jgi:hypothetical protein